MTVAVGVLALELGDLEGARLLVVLIADVGRGRRDVRRVQHPHLNRRRVLRHHLLHGDPRLRQVRRRGRRALRAEARGQRTSLGDDDILPSSTHCDSQLDLLQLETQHTSRFLRLLLVVRRIR